LGELTNIEKEVFHKNGKLLYEIRRSAIW